MSNRSEAEALHKDQCTDNGLYCTDTAHVDAIESALTQAERRGFQKAARVVYDLHHDNQTEKLQAEHCTCLVYVQDQLIKSEYDARSALLAAKGGEAVDLHEGVKSTNGHLDVIHIEPSGGAG